MFAVNDLSKQLLLTAIFVSSLFSPAYAQTDIAQRAAEEAIAAASELASDELNTTEGEEFFAESEIAFDEGNDDSESDFSDEGSSYTSYSSDPVRVETTFDFIGQMKMNYVIVRAKEDMVVLHDLVINRGNCGYTLSGQMDAPFPVNIAFGNGAKYLLKCSTVLEVTVHTNFGEHTYQFNP